MTNPTNILRSPAARRDGCRAKSDQAVVGVVRAWRVRRAKRRALHKSGLLRLANYTFHGADPVGPFPESSRAGVG